jgi:hypothetical protein
MSDSDCNLDLETAAKGSSASGMKLYVCWGTHAVPGHRHACRVAQRALLEAGHAPQVVKVRGQGVGPRFMHWMTAGRREVEELSGQRAVPVLITDDGETIVESAAIVEWVAQSRRSPASS